MIADLVERFEQQGEAHKPGEYNEAQLRKEFLDPMFKALDDKVSLQRQIDATDTQIDKLVYELYGLTDGEIKIVEAATPQAVPLS